MKDREIDLLLKNSLARSETPGADLIRRVKNLPLKEDNVKTRKIMPITRIALIAAAVVLVASTALAAWMLLSPQDMANEVLDSALASAFESNEAVYINETQTSGGYEFTLLGLVSGEDITDYVSEYDGVELTDRTFAAVAIGREDGSAMPASTDENYGNPPFYVTPLIKGEMPWRVNIHTLNGGYFEFVKDGVMYRMIECDNLEMFADRTLYLAISIGSFYDNEVFSYAADTGEITRNEDYEGISALFNLPLDASKADPEAAAARLAEILAD